MSNQYPSNPFVQAESEIGYFPPAGPFPAEKAIWVETILNVCEGESLRVDGYFEQAAWSAIRRFQQKYSLPPTGGFDNRTLIALTQRALNRIQNSSILLITGTMDLRTKAEIVRFQASNLLTAGGIVDRDTRAAMVALLNSLKGGSSPPIECDILECPVPPRPGPIPGIPSSIIYKWNGVSTSNFPPVVLVHGVRSNMDTWTNPGGPRYDYIFDYSKAPPDGNDGRHFRPPIIPVDPELVPSRRLASSGLFGFLSLQNPKISVIAFDQRFPDGPIQHAVDDLKLIIDGILGVVTYPRTNTKYEKVILVAHSRGGLVCRSYIQQFCHSINKVSKLMTIATPHSGSNLANLKVKVSREISNVKTTLGKRIPAIRKIGIPAILSPSPADPELEVGGAFIRKLNSDTPIRDIKYYLAAGTNITIKKFYIKLYKSSAFIPSLPSPPFLWEYTHKEVLDILKSIPQSIRSRIGKELVEGQGDVLVLKNSALGLVDPNNPSSSRIAAIAHLSHMLVVNRYHGDIVIDPVVMNWVHRNIVTP